MQDIILKKKEHDPMMHWGCCWQPLLAKLFWVGSLLTLFYAWVAESQGDAFLGRTTGAWYGDALALGILAIGLKLSGCRHKWCASCGVKRESE